MVLMIGVVDRLCQYLLRQDQLRDELKSPTLAGHLRIAAAHVQMYRRCDTIGTSGPEDFQSIPGRRGKCLGMPLHLLLATWPWL